MRNMFRRDEELTSLNPVYMSVDSDDHDKVPSADAPPIDSMFWLLSIVSLVAAAFAGGVAVGNWGCKETPLMSGDTVSDVGDLMQLSSSGIGRKRRVFVFRHCIRSTDTTVHGSDARDYAGHDLPRWRTPSMWCTEGGHNIMRRTGQKLAQDFGVDHRALKITSDVVMRDVQTGLALLEGISNPSGEQKIPVVSKQIVFDASVENTLVAERNGGVPTPGCEAPDTDILRAEIQNAVASTPFPSGIGLVSSKDFEEKYRTVIQRLEDIVGKGTKSFIAEGAPRVAVDIHNRHSKVTAHGGFEIIKFLSQQMTYSWASGEPWVDWPGVNLSQADYMFWNAWEFFAREIKIPRGWKVTAATKMIQTIIANLRSPSEGGLHDGMTHIFTGHDTTLDVVRAGLNLTWTAPPFDIWPDDYVFPGSGPTPLGSALMFTVEQGSEEVHVDFVYSAFDGTSNPELKVSPVAVYSTVAEMEQKAKSISNEYSAAAACWSKVAKNYVNL